MLCTLTWFTFLNTVLFVQLLPVASNGHLFFFISGWYCMVSRCCASFYDLLSIGIYLFASQLHTTKNGAAMKILEHVYLFVSGNIHKHFHLIGMCYG